MNIVNNRIALNRQVAPHLSLHDFLKLASECHFKYVELRNDIAPYYNVCDNHSVEEVRAWLDRYQLSVLTINALGKFNYYQDNQLLINNLTSLCEIASQLECQNLVLCPACQPNGDFLKISAETMFENTRAALSIMYPILTHYNITGLIEPLGFTFSGFRDIEAAKRLIENLDDCFKLVFDTFHFYLFKQINHQTNYFEDQFKEEITTVVKNLLPYIKLIHLSSVNQNITADSMRDEHRVLVNVNNDLIHTYQQVQLLNQLGYQGFYSLEPFSPTYINMSDVNLKYEITESRNLITGIFK